MQVQGQAALQHSKPPHVVVAQLQVLVLHHKGPTPLLLEAE
jgi:hypothetical protein